MDPVEHPRSGSPAGGPGLHGAADATARGKLSAWRLAAFSLISLPIAGAGLPLAVYLPPYYAQYAGLGLSAAGYAFLGGLLEHADALCAIGSPTVNSYKRLQPGMWAPAFKGYGLGNRSAMIRVVQRRPGQPGPARLELRCPAPACKSDYISSQSWLDLAANKLGILLGSHAVLNLVVLGVLTCVLLALGVTAAVLALDLSRRNQVIATALILLVVADSAFFGYFASVLSEGAGFLGILLSIAGLLLMHRNGWWRYAGAAVATAGGLIGINAKSQTLLLIPVFVLAVLLARPAKLRGWTRWALPLAVLAIVGAGTLLTQGKGDSANAEYREANVYHVIFDSIVDGKHDSAADLAALGLPAEFAKYAGTGWWSPHAAWHDPANRPHYIYHGDPISGLMG